MTTTLVEFLTARLDEDYALSATAGRWKAWGMAVMADRCGTSDVAAADLVARTFSTNEEGRPRTYDADFLCRFDPQRVLREVAAKRAILDEFVSRRDQAEQARSAVFKAMVGEQQEGLRIALRWMASTYSDHPHYREEWRQ